MGIENRKEASRKKSLGELGELFAIKALVDKKFDRIRNLNDNHMNEKFADIECEKDGLRYVISVKARNKYQKNGKLNTRYNVGSTVYEKALAQRKNTMLLPIGWQYNSIINHSQYILVP
jgi:predicted KAP-like P-loop ATPase